MHFSQGHPGSLSRAAAAKAAAQEAARARLGAAPEVSLAGDRPDSDPNVRLAEFEGPLGLLLALIEARQLDVLTVPLGGLAESYLEALATLEGDRLSNVSGFVAVAAQLILIKSRAILPRPPETVAVPLDDEPDPEAALRARLVEYRRYRDAGARLGEIPAAWTLFRREPELAIAAGKAGARPPERPPLPPSVLVRALDRLATIVPPPLPAPGLVARVVTLEERTAIIRAALSGAGCFVLQELLAGVHDRVVVAVTFLALLELSKQREITLEQAEPWGPIVARRVPSVGEADSADDAESDEADGACA